MFVVVCLIAQKRRLALAGCLHPRLGQKSLMVDFDVLVNIGAMVRENGSLVTRDEAAAALATEQRRRALKGEATLVGAIARKRKRRSSHHLVMPNQVDARGLARAIGTPQSPSARDGATGALLAAGVQVTQVVWW
eukprot:COSAG02_NODE_2013_length_10111_cov_24.161039_1_plen_135_part_00